MPAIASPRCFRVWKLEGTRHFSAQIFTSELRVQQSPRELLEFAIIVDKNECAQSVKLQADALFQTSRRLRDHARLLARTVQP